MEVIIPAAGLSTRFPNMRPKYSLVDYSGNLMIESSFKPYLLNSNITIGLNKQNEKKYSIINYLKKKYKKKIKFVVLNKLTKGPADTVFQILKKTKINSSKEILIKDCDTFFNQDDTKGNVISVADIKDFNILKNLKGKSFVKINKENIVIDIIEKKIVSDLFCCGGYKFKNKGEFMTAYNKIKKIVSGEIFVSHVIQQMINDDKIFTFTKAKNYTDVGTFDEWHNYNQKPVVFCDIDGTIIRSQKKDQYKTKPKLLKNNIKKIKELVSRGSQIIFVTSRPQSAFKDTNKMLISLGFFKFRLIMGLLNSKRILINDFNQANPYPNAIAYNIYRDEDSLDKILNI
jgi:hypothetical protein